MRAGLVLTDTERALSQSRLDMKVTVQFVEDRASGDVGRLFSASSDQQYLMLRARLDADFPLRLKLPPRRRARRE